MDGWKEGRKRKTGKKADTHEHALGQQEGLRHRGGRQEPGVGEDLGALDADAIVAKI